MNNWFAATSEGIQISDNANHLVYPIPQPEIDIFPAGAIAPLDGLVLWDADVLREIEHRGTVSKWQGPTLTTGIEGEVLVWVDLFGNWREEIVAHADSEICVYTTTIPAQDRRVTLVQDPLYRMDMALKAMGYDQIPMTSYYLGADTGPSRARPPLDQRLAPLTADVAPPECRQRVG